MYILINGLCLLTLKPPHVKTVPRLVKSVNRDWSWILPLPVHSAALPWWRMVTLTDTLGPGQVGRTLGPGWVFPASGSSQLHQEQQLGHWASGGPHSLVQSQVQGRSVSQLFTNESRQKGSCHGDASPHVQCKRSAVRADLLQSETKARPPPRLGLSGSGPNAGGRGRASAAAGRPTLAGGAGLGRTGRRREGGPNSAQAMQQPF